MTVADSDDAGPTYLDGSPYSHSMLGKYARMILLCVAVPLLGWFAYQAITQGSAIVFLVATVVLLVTLFLPHGSWILRVGVLLALTMNVIAFVINANYAVGRKNDTIDFAAYLLLFCLCIASVFEFKHWFRQGSRDKLIKTLFWGLLAIPAVIYIVGLPLLASIVEAIQGQAADRPVDDLKWNWLNETSFRAAKFGVFAAFTYLGACLGSFLNVVAHSMPRGRSILFRNSSCPQCDAEIQRIDNLPILGYVNLAGRCRNCQQTIPIRYLVVELIAATIFGSLFLYELVAGCPNIPSIPTYTHKGILWMILYPKWPAIGIYFFHALFMCAILVLALIEWDRQAIKKRHALILGLAFFIPAAIFLKLLPVPLTEHLAFLSFQLSPLIEQLLKPTIGGIVGATVGAVFGLSPLARHSRSLVLAFALTGMVLGWQGLLQVTIVFMVLLMLTRLISPLWQMIENRRVTSLLLAAVMLHHPFWRSISNLW